MANTLTETDIANLALDACGGCNSIQSIDDPNNPDAVLIKRVFSHCVKTELEKHEWSFARKIKAINQINYEAYPDLDLRSDGYYGYELPSDFSRLSISFFGEYYVYRTNQYDMKHHYFLVGDKYLYISRQEVDTNNNPIPLRIPYCSNNVAISDWQTLFIDVVVYALAKRICGKIQGLDANVEIYESLYRDAKRLARNQMLIQNEATSTGYSDTQIDRADYFGGF